MSEFLQIKKNTGETVTNGVLDIGRARVHATTVERGAFTGSSYDLSSYRNLDHMSCIIKTFDGFSNPYVSKNGDSFVVWNRFWMNQSPNPKFTIQFLDSSGLATSSYTGSYGVKIFGNNKKFKR